MLAAKLARRGMIRPSRSRARSGWSQWSPCTKRENGLRTRYQQCAKPNLQLCPAQTEQCNRKTGSERFSLLNRRAPLPARSLVPTVRPGLHAAVAVASERAQIAGPFITVTPEQSASRLDISLQCEPGTCCPISQRICTLGLRQLADGNLEFCTNPCGNRRLKQ